MTYNVRCQVDGWPEGVTKEEKELLTLRVKEFIKEVGPQPLYVIERHIAYKIPRDQWPNRSILWDHIYATVERACVAANLETVWKFKEF